MTMTLVERVELTSSQASITFSNIPQDGTDLLVFVSARNDSGAGDQLLMSFNGVTTNRSSRRLRGNGSDAASATSSDIFGYLVDANQTANTFSNASYYIPNYAGSTAKLVSVDVVTENNGTAAYQSIVAALWNSTDPITSISLIPNAGNLVSGSSASLYKITKGSDGTTTVA